jgi:putative DNA methylase
MNLDNAELLSASGGFGPLSLNGAPSFIEAQFPVGRLSAEAYKERKAVAGQTLTALGSYWKGRKPLILCRAVVLGCLLPTTNFPDKDLDVFLKLMGMDDAAFGRRFNGSAAEFTRLFPAYAELATEDQGHRRVWREDLTESERQERVAEAFAALPYTDRLKHVRRPEECEEGELLAPIWGDVNRHLGTAVLSLGELVNQLGIARYGHRPRAADTFCGAGSIPFEAARVGCDVFASDLNPIACMLTWGAFNIVGGSVEARACITAGLKRIEDAVDAEITRLGIESDERGNRGKAYLYCLETRCPKTGWMVPILPSLVISDARGVVAKLVPNELGRCYEIEIVTGASAADMAEAAKGTLRQGRLVHPMNPERTGVEIRTIRGDYRGSNGVSGNRLRLWEKDEFSPRVDDIFQERLYCIQWITKETFQKRRQETFFASVTEADLKREKQVRSIVEENLAIWREEGKVPDVPIIPGKENEGPIRTNGWSYWHQLFMPRALLTASLLFSYRQPATSLAFAKYIDNNSASFENRMGAPQILARSCSLTEW